MSNLVYLMCSLPALTFGQNPTITLDEFNKDAKSQLSTKHFKKLEAADIRKSDSNGTKSGLKSIDELLDDVRQDCSEIRNAKAQSRTPNLNRLPKAVLGANPLEREKMIMQLQWDELESAGANETFTFTEVVVYKLKLQILNRLHSFDEERGAQVLASVVNPAKKEEA